MLAYSCENRHAGVEGLLALLTVVEVVRTTMMTVVVVAAAAAAVVEELTGGLSARTEMATKA